MLSTAIVFASLAAVFSTVNAGGGSWHSKITNLALERLDPVVQPNQIAGHMHRIFGGSAFSAFYNYDDQMASDCTSAQVTADRSNYWVPQLYWINADKSGQDGVNSFTSLPGGARFYYFLDFDPVTKNITAFPPGLRMLAGNPNSKTPAPYITWGCMGGEAQGRTFNWNQTCPLGIQGIIRFPSCWDGFNLYKDDNSHVVYASNQVGGLCPFDHPVKIPAITLEVTWRHDQLGLGGQVVAGKLALANGDTTGYGYHGDFTNGWDTKVLQAALDNAQCTSGDGIDIGLCEVFAPIYQSERSAQGCVKPAARLATEKWGTADGVAIPALPGCNKIWGASGSKPTCDANWDVPPSISGQTGTQQAKSIGSNPPNYITDTKGKWADLGCLQGQGAFANGKSYSDSSKMTQESCQLFCGNLNMTYAAISTTICYCGNTLDRTQLMRTGCDTPCSGNSSQTCGVSYSAEVYYNSAPAARDLSSSVYVGCYQDTTARNVNGYYYWTTTMTPDMCMKACAELNSGFDVAAMQSGNQCTCGTMAQLQKGAILPDDKCNMPCAGNSTFSCGGKLMNSGYRISAEFRKAVIDGLPSKADPSWLGCADAGSGNQALTAYSYYGSEMTVAICKSICSKGGYSIAGLDSGNRCKCDTSYKVPLVKAPAMRCDRPCAGNANEICGGSPFANFYNITSQTAAPGSTIGCFTDSNPRALSSWSYPDSLNTQDRCATACRLTGYSLSAVNGATCSCGDKIMGGALPDSQCDTKCAGNTTQACGGWNKATVKSTDAAVVPYFSPGYTGCYVESRSVKLLSGSVMQSVMNNGAYCVSRCRSLNYKLAGTMGNICACGDAFVGTGGQRVGDPICSTPCPGGQETCGLEPSKFWSIYNTNGTSSYSNANAPVVGSSSATRSTSMVASTSLSSTSVKSSTVSGSASMGSSTTRTSTMSAGISSASTSTRSSTATSQSSTIGTSSRATGTATLSNMNGVVLPTGTTSAGSQCAGTTVTVTAVSYVTRTVTASSAATVLPRSGVHLFQGKKKPVRRIIFGGRQ